MDRIEYDKRMSELERALIIIDELMTEVWDASVAYGIEPFTSELAEVTELLHICKRHYKALWVAIEVLTNQKRPAPVGVFRKKYLPVWERRKVKLTEEEECALKSALKFTSRYTFKTS